MMKTKDVALEAIESRERIHKRYARVGAVVAMWVGVGFAITNGVDSGILFPAVIATLFIIVWD